jgi:hypothetical protein
MHPLAIAGAIALLIVLFVLVLLIDVLWGNGDSYMPAINVESTEDEDAFRESVPYKDQIGE